MISDLGFFFSHLRLSEADKLCVLFNLQALYCQTVGESHYTRRKIHDTKSWLGCQEVKRPLKMLFDCGLFVLYFYGLIVKRNVCF